MRIEVEVAKDDTGLFRATAIAYPEVTATGRTETEALGLLMEAMERYMKRQAGLRNFAENPAQLHPVFRLCIRLEVEHVVVHRLIDLFSINGGVEVLITLKEFQLRDSR